jgi:hypothetical protein
MTVAVLLLLMVAFSFLRLLPKTMKAALAKEAQLSR